MVDLSVFHRENFERTLLSTLDWELLDIPSERLLVSSGGFRAHRSLLSSFLASPCSLSLRTRGYLGLGDLINDFLRKSSLAVQVSRPRACPLGTLGL